MDYKHFNTVGQLMDILKTYPADTIIVSKNKNTMEQRGYQLDNCITGEPEKFKIVTEETCDAFDGIPYRYDCIIPVSKTDNIDKNIATFEAIRFVN